MADSVKFVAGGTVQAGGGVYIPREADQELLALCRSGAFAYVLTPRQMGKSSLMVQTANILREQEIRPVTVDLTTIGTQLDTEAWYLGLLTTICRQLGLLRQLMKWWQAHKHLGVTQRLTQFIEEVMLTEVSERIVIFVDEIDTTLNLDFTDDFFIAIRAFYLARAENSEFARLSFVLFGVATPSDLICNPQRTPFNIGQRVDLTDFTFEEALPLADGFALPTEEAQQLLHWVLDWTGGHPYLTQRLCQTLCKENRKNWSEDAVAEVVSRIFLGDASKQDTNLQFVRDMLTKRSPDITAGLTVYREVLLNKQKVIDEEQSLVKSHLKLSGVVKRRSDGVLQVRNRIYQKVFDLAWVREHLPINWLKSLRRAAITSGIIFLVATAPLGIFAEMERRKAVNLARIASIRENTTKVSFYLPTARAAEGLVLAMHATIKSRELDPEIASDVLSVVDSSMLRAFQEAKEQMVFQGHEGEVLTAAFSPDDQLIVSGGVDNTVRLWDLQGKSIGEPLKHESAVISVAFSSDVQKITAVGRNGVVKQWDVNGKLIESNEVTINSNILHASFSADGQVIAATLADGSFAVGNISGGEWKKWFVNDPPIRKLSANLSQLRDSYSFQGQAGQEILISMESNDFDTVLILENSTGASIASDDNGGIGSNSLLKVVFPETGVYNIVATGNNSDFSGNYDLVINPTPVKNISISPDGRQLAIALPDGTIQFWDSQGNRIGTSSQKHQGAVLAVAFSSDGQRIVSGGSDRIVRLWDSEGNPIGEPFQGHNGEVLSVAFSSDNQRIVSGGRDGTLRLWDLKGNSLGEPFRGHGSGVISVAFSADNQSIVSSSRDNTFRIWEANVLAPFKGHEYNVRYIAFSPDGQLIVSGSDDQTLRLWDLQGNQIGQPFQGLGTGAIVGVAFSPDGQLIASDGGDQTVRLWDLQGNQIGQPFQGHKDNVHHVAFSPDGQLIASTSLDRTVRLWDLQGNQIGQPFQGHEETSSGVAFSPDGQLIVSSGHDRTLRLWDLQGNQIGQPFQGHEGRVFDIAFSPDGQLIASGSSDRTVRLWDLQGNQIGQPFQGHEGDVFDVAFSPDGQRIASGSSDGTVRLWDLQGNQIGQPFREHENGVVGVAFSPDGRRIASGSWDDTVRLRWASWEEWLQNSCNRLQHHPILRNPDESLGEDFSKIASEVSAACEQRIWEKD